MQISSRNSQMLTAFALIAVAFLAVGSVVTIIATADAANANSESRNKGQRGELMSDGKRQGNGGGGGNPDCGSDPRPPGCKR
jgi:hypothetical protein